MRDKFLSLPLDDVILFELPVADADQKVCAAARKFIAQKRTVAFVEVSNSENGVAPTVMETARELIRHCDELREPNAYPGLRRSLAQESQ